jgi:transposase
MDHVAIDLGGRESQICVRQSDGTIVEERRVRTSSLRAFLWRRAKSRVVLETCAEAFTVADAALEHGHEVRVVPATLVRSLGVGSRRTKTDRRDAQILSEVSCRIDLPSVHVPTEASRRRKSMCGMREALVGARTKLINCVRGWLRTQGVRIRSGGVSTFPQRVRHHFQAETPTPLPPYVERMLATIEQLNLQLDEADKELAEVAAKDPQCQRLMTVPGVGPVTSVRFVAALDEHQRFPSAHAVQAYLGLVPGENSSSERQERLSITKAGARAVRWTLVQAAWSARRYRPNDPMVRWSLEVEKRRGKRVAVVALARKLAGILFAIWRDGSTYDPRRGASGSEHE